MSSIPPAADVLVVDGGDALRGGAVVTGFKHSMVPIVGAALAHGSTVTIANCPDIVETSVLHRLIEQIGGRSRRDGARWTIDPRTIEIPHLDPALAGQIHGAVYLLPALVSRFGHATVMTNGGCQIGNGPGGQRPSRQYTDVLRRFGAQARLQDNGDLTATSSGLIGCEIDLKDYTTDQASDVGNLYSGASKTALLCGLMASGTTILHNLYSKADVTELVVYARAAGHSIEQPNAATLIIDSERRCPNLPIEHTLIPDLIEILTWICVGTLLCESPFVISGHGVGRAEDALRAELDALRRMGVELSIHHDSIVVLPVSLLRAMSLTASHFDSVFSDSQPFFALLATFAQGRSTIRDEVWTGRFQYANELNALGAKIDLGGAHIDIQGPVPPVRGGIEVRATDLRSAAVLLMAALAVPGRTVIHGARHLARGYPNLPEALRAAGARIRLRGAEAERP